MVKNKKGFTLIELLIVIGIIGLLATLAIVSLTSAQRKARDTKRIADMKSIQTAMELYWNENAGYPELTASTTTWSGTSSSLQSALTKFISVMPIDPQSTASYSYSTLQGTKPQKYLLTTTLEDTSHDALDQDIDGNQAEASGWIRVTSTASTTATNLAAVVSCADAVYCLTGNAE